MIETVGVFANLVYWCTFMNLTFVSFHGDCQVVHSSFH